MATCKLFNLVPACDYTVEGIVHARLLAMSELDGLDFEGGNYDSALVTAIFRRGDYVPLPAPVSAKYAMTKAGDIYTHVLDTFVGDLGAEFQAQLHLGGKTRYLALFLTAAGKWHVFGYDSGAAVSFGNQTAEGAGSLVTITAASIHPLFEVMPSAVDSTPSAGAFVPDFNNGASCEIL